MTSTAPLSSIIEAVLMASEKPLTVDELLRLFSPQEHRTKQQVVQALRTLQTEYESRVVNLVEVASGFTFRVRALYSPWVAKLFEDPPARYSRALLETLALIAYRQPITRAEIEDIRGVTVSSNTIRTLTDRGWIQIVGHKELPGKPALFATTKSFLDYFNLKRLDDLPTVDQIHDVDSMAKNLELTFDADVLEPAAEVLVLVPQPDHVPELDRDVAPRLDRGVAEKDDELALLDEV